MSRRPGIGKTFYDKYKNDIYPSDEVIINGIKMKPPHYYDNLLKEEDPDTHDLVAAERATQGEKHKHNKTTDRLRVREEVQRAKQNHYTKRNVN